MKASELSVGEGWLLADLAPLWFAILTGKSDKIGANSSERKKLNLLGHSSCVVGELHGFDDSYAHTDSKNYCKECSNLSLVFARILRQDSKKRSKLIKILEEHWYQKHAKRC